MTSATTRRTERAAFGVMPDGAAVELLTNQPGLQFYSGNLLDGGSSGRDNRLYRQSDAPCLEPQAWPNAPNRSDFPSARLDRGQLYRHVTVYRFTRGATS